MITISKKSINLRPAVAHRHEDEPIVRNGLAITPSEMVEMMRQGMPISAQGYSLKDESITMRNDYEVPLEHTRGFDLVDGWNKMKEVQSKVRKVRKAVQDGTLQTIQEGV